MRSQSVPLSLLVLLAALVLLATACGGGKAAGTYYCPMHPTYVSDRPGTCPICNMDLVLRPVEGETAPAVHDAGHLHREAAEVPGGTVYACPMHPSVAAPGPGICAKCNMELVPAPGATLPATPWTCPMHPEVVSDAPGRCPLCRMDLVPRQDEVPAELPPHEAHGEVPGDLRPGELPAHAAVTLSGEGLRLAGVRTAEVREERLTRTVRTVGRVTIDERRLHRVQAKVAGWVESLAVSFEGQPVRRGEPMLALYSPELLATQEEYLLARQHAERLLASSVPEVRRGAEELVSAARRRLALFDVPESFLAALDASGRARRTVELLAPASGHVISREVVAGARIEPGMPLFTLADLSRVWVEADFYESEARFVRPGARAELRLPYDPETAFSAPVAYVYPELDPESRTVRARFDLANPELRLKPGMFVDVELPIDLGTGIVVDDSAVIDSGAREVVFVAAGGGRFEPRAVRVLWRGEGRARLAPGGVTPGERVATGANFLLDAESRLRAALAALGSPAAPAPHAGHGGQP